MLKRIKENYRQHYFEKRSSCAEQWETWNCLLATITIDLENISNCQLIHISDSFQFPYTNKQTK